MTDVTPKHYLIARCAGETVLCENLHDTFNGALEDMADWVDDQLDRTCMLGVSDGSQPPMTVDEYRLTELSGKAPAESEGEAKPLTYTDTLREVLAGRGVYVQTREGAIAEIPIDTISLEMAGVILGILDAGAVGIKIYEQGDDPTARTEPREVLPVYPMPCRVYTYITSVGEYNILADTKEGADHQAGDLFDNLSMLRGHEVVIFDVVDGPYIHGSIFDDVSNFEPATATHILYWLVAEHGFTDPTDEVTHDEQ